jgi:hypothetical protein
MGKFKAWIKKIIGGFNNKSISPPARPLASKIELEIDFIVETNLKNFSHLEWISSSPKYWQAAIKAICYAESSFNPFETYWEKTLGDHGIDPVNGSKYLSEGLMQLSYSDKEHYSCDFDWKADKNKSEYDQTKTIFNIEKNIMCGMKILDELIRKHGNFIFNDGNYWAVLMPRNKRHQIFKDKFNQYLKEA